MYTGPKRLKMRSTFFPCRRIRTPSFLSSLSAKTKLRSSHDPAELDMTMHLSPNTSVHALNPVCAHRLTVEQIGLSRTQKSLHLHTGVDAVGVRGCQRVIFVKKNTLATYVA